MKKRIFILFLIFAASFYSNNISAQKLSSLSITERNRTIIEIAQNTYKKYPDFYRVYGTPSITEKKVPFLKMDEFKQIDSNPAGRWKWATGGEIYYIVKFPYDETKELFPQLYAAEVYISDNREPFAITLGDGVGYALKTVPITKYSINYKGSASSYLQNNKWATKQGDEFTVTVADQIPESKIYRLKINVTNGQVLKGPIHTRREAYHDAVDGWWYDITSTYTIKSTGGNITIDINFY